MLPFKKIIAPTDFSDESLIALHAASDIAQYFQAELHIAHVIEPLRAPAHSLTSPGTIASTTIPVHDHLAWSEAEERLRQIVDVHISGGAPTHAVVEFGDPAERIVSLARGQSADLIVIATHGETGFREVVSGSVTLKVVLTSPAPVLTIQSQRVR